jgi:hypothetical protein
MFQADIKVVSYDAGKSQLKVMLPELHPGVWSGRGHSMYRGV